MDVQNVMEKMQQRNRELFQVPPYILYVARAFSTLEGIGLSANDDYSIVSEAFPYLSQRLLTDESPRAKAALRSMVYGTSEESAVNEKTPSLSKLVSIGEGFTSYSSATSSAPADQDAAASRRGARGVRRRVFFEELHAAARLAHRLLGHAPAVHHEVRVQVAPRARGHLHAQRFAHSARELVK